MINLKNKIIVVVGGNGLLGKEFVKQIRENEGIAINADINLDSDLDKHIFGGLTVQKIIITASNFQKIMPIIHGLR